jgi:hypothetical protein
LPNFYAAPIYTLEALIEFALCVSYLPVGLGRAEARPFFWFFDIFQQFAYTLTDQISAVCKLRAQGKARANKPHAQSAALPHPHDLL